MALSWYLGARIRKCMFLSEELLEFVLMCIAICMSLPSTSYAQTPAQTGFLSIDCGYTGASYNDSLGITWVADDETFITTGKTANQSYVNSDFGESGQVSQTFRYFPEPRSKYCYNLTTDLDADVPYLIRANFYLNGSVFNQSLPFIFSVFINANNWFTITSGEDSPPEFHVIEEAIFYSVANMTYFCLQPVVGVPFISSLELRPLEVDMYSYSIQYDQYLVLLSRWNVGANSTPPVRFPDDRFDRIWHTPDASSADFFTIISSPTPPDNTSRADVYYVPPKVMQDGWLMSGPTSVLFSLSAEFAYTGDQVYMLPAEYAFAILYTEYLNNSDLQTYSAHAYLDNHYIGSSDFNHTANMQTVPNFVLDSNVLNVGFDDLNLAMGPTLNAIEIYGQVNFNFSHTDSDDVNAIQALKTSLSLTDWQGDPCIPVPHDWLSCTYWSVFGPDVFQPIEQPCGSNSTLVKECQVDQGSYSWNPINFVTALKFSKLGENGLRAFVSSSEFFSDRLPSLTELRLTNSGADDQTFLLLIANVLTYLPQLAILDLSFNAMSFLPTTSMNITWPNTLVSLDLSHNLLQEISFVDKLIGMNDLTLRTLNVSHNNLKGTFNSSLYFSRLPNLTIANFDYNSINGTLDLSAWNQALQMVASKSPAKNSSILVDTLSLFSFLNNSISDIYPSADTFGAITNILTENQTFQILLGGNPYCNRAKSYLQRYLCRSSVNEYVPKDHKSNRNYIMIISVCIGGGAFILLFVTLVTLWKLWKQVYELREIQQALANRKVQPPFYQYDDLKNATRDFQNDYKLEHGGFGIVYKGVLQDNTTLAVKRLFNSQRLQELDEFLNEVVLITGIKHKNLVQLKGCCIKDKLRMLIYEYVEKGNLAEALWGSKVHGVLNWEHRFNICVGVARGLSYLHEELQPSIIHRDIKPENVLLDRNFKPKIADFGLARQFEETNQAHYTQVAGTLGYVSPEYASEGQLSNKADVYSYGILVLEVVSGRKCIDHSLPLEEKFLKDWVRKMHKNGLAFEILQSELKDNCDETQVMRAVNIGLLCVQHDPERRPSMSTVVTMLLGTADVDVLLDVSDHVHSDFNTFLLTINNELENPTFHSIVEAESPNFHLLDLGWESSSSYPPTSRQSSKSLVELSTIQRR